jgi:C4-type Zn-finger protein
MGAEPHRQRRVCKRYVRDLIRRDQNAQTRRLSVEDIRRTIEEGRAAAGGASSAEDVFARIEDKLRRLAG